MSSTSIKASAIVQDIVKLENEVADINFIKEGLYNGSLLKLKTTKQCI